MMKIYTCDPNGYKKGIEVLRQYNLGVMISPHPKHVPLKSHSELPFLAIDNGAFRSFITGEPFDKGSFLKCLEKCENLDLVLDFVVCPDIVGGGKRSLDFSMMWRDILWMSNVALVVNDSLSITDIESVIGEFSHLFISSKFSKNWLQWRDLGARHNKNVHVGACGTEDKLRYAWENNFASCDSSNFYRNNTFGVIDRVRNGTYIPQMNFDF
jgi:hypothetical protein